MEDEDTFYLSEKSKGCLEIYDYEFLESLLKNEVKLYGKFVAEVFVNKTSIYKYLKSENLIRGWGYMVFKDIIERDLYPYILSSNISTNNSEEYSRVQYKLNINDVQINLSIVFTNKIPEIFSKDDVIFLQKFSTVYLDIDLLQVDRYGVRIMWLPKLYKDSPNPFQEICLNIKNKRFRVLSDTNVSEWIFFKNLVHLILNGWTHNTRLIKKQKLGTYMEISCVSCEKNNISDLTEINIIKLPCGHYYHYTCWIEYVKNTVKESSMKSVVFKCLECNSILPNWEVVC